MGQDRKPPTGTPKLRVKAQGSLESKGPALQELSLDQTRKLVLELQADQVELARQNEALRRGQASLEEASQSCRDFYDFAPVGFLTLDEAGLIREVNRTAASQLGVNRDRIIGKSWWGFLADADQGRGRIWLEQVFQAQGVPPCEIKLHRPDGRDFFARLDRIAATDINGVRVCRTSVTDLIDLKQAEEKLRESEGLFGAFMEHLPSVAIMRDLEGRYLFANTAWEQAFHKTRREWVGRTTEELWPAEVAEKFKAQDRQVIETGEALQSLEPLPHPDGRLRNWISYRFPIVDQDGHVVMIGINAIDVTEPMATEARLEQVLASGPVAIYTCKPGGGFSATYISDNSQALVGWEPRNFLADSSFWLNHLHPGDRPRILAQLEFPWPEDRLTLEYRFLARDGVYRWMLDEVKLVRDQNGKPLEIAGA
jgi:PAS domain S-box-containing protein